MLIYRSSSEWTSFSGNAITALTFANYILDPFYPECLPPPEAVRLIAACLICKPFLTFTFHLPAFKHQTKNWSSGFLTAVNCWNVKWATRVQDVATVTKVLKRFLLWGIFRLKDFNTLTFQIAALLIIVVAGLIFLAVSPSSHSAIAPDQLMQVFVAWCKMNR